MKLIVGLGNPGNQYVGTRHNIGFDVIDHIASSNSEFSPFETQKIFQSEISKGTIANKKVMLIKPMTYMNASGVAVRKVCDSLKIESHDIIVIHDDISLDLGIIKISKGKGSGKHKGVQSIIDNIQTNEFVRVRCGIGRGTGVLSDVVLSKFSSNEKLIVKNIVQKGTEKTMKELHNPIATE